ncbi:rhomboid family intramembrane serine protease [Cryptosporangium aurantiacum]|uniref:Membrane associated serine protease, rhomboid family n=1 Tax=Cryptosporangium aurantiacum TaxID=134849 RepID=A0A1M7RKG9_9ACTN|nr:rhomboid family intramembrane serine protease [Cryptosporangium aurantiacum]SHN46807.1 Membrane associated serine protease, rhomboid family [Cryptosporangium aurantiacum]
MTEDSARTTATPVCYRHPDRSTYVSCVRCDRPICPDCMQPASVGFQCPECVREGRKTTTQARTVFGGGLSGEQGTVTRTLVIINVAAWVLTLVAAVLTGEVGLRQLGRFVIFGGITGVTEWGAAVPAYSCGFAGEVCGGIASGEFWRLLTADFLHYGLIHLAFNMYALWILGRECERLLGRGRFLALYLFAGVGGSVAVYLFSPLNEASAGASASIFGLLGAMFFFLRRLRADPRGLVFLIVLNFSLGFVVANISIWGHIGGFVVGAAVGALMAYLPSGPNRARLQWMALSAVGAALLILVALRTASFGIL